MDLFPRKNKAEAAWRVWSGMLWLEVNLEMGVRTVSEVIWQQVKPDLL